ncbi:carboxymuconolactone decarboxylase family protein [Variovorax sp. J22P240]|uniref:carboxymuconolactone decarboxylase family protein n=1 Tax=Variovorax sp. J22P240 TaxID=3053514 RepID=UPI002575B01B|nr:carboxymuconolactone decarboxylase family protein [Variovorax sp. J22P240]MDM0000773.1 carboxymuconolactone decarboxylase family protein [Variovorax sp. J22P240]
MEHDNDRSATPVCDAMRAAGEWNPKWEQFAELDPAWTEKFMAMVMTPLASSVLDAKTIEFICIAVDASCTHMYGPGVRRHIGKALALGATKQEITAVLQLVSVLGIHTMSLGAPILLEELDAAVRRDADVVSRTPSEDLESSHRHAGIRVSV